MFGALSRFDPLPRIEAGSRISLAGLLLRLGLGAIFIFHAWVKIDFHRGELGVDWALQDRQFARTLIPVPLTYPWMQFAVAWGELLGGIALVLGLFTRIAALGMIVIQVGAIWMATSARGFLFDKTGGWEHNFVLLAGCLTVFILGGGAVAFDHLAVRARKKAAEKPAALQPV
jgi:putative oxidoreductase